jgi:hypothetical protein
VVKESGNFLKKTATARPAFAGEAKADLSEYRSHCRAAAGTSLYFRRTPVWDLSKKQVRSGKVRHLVRPVFRMAGKSGQN